ncbi:MAG: hypothetical protein AAF235_10460, partial [Planctomycetota bacterium]
MLNQLPTSSAWATHLRNTGMSSLRGSLLDPDSRGTDAEHDRFIEAFRDERGHRRRVDAPLLSRLLDRPVTAGAHDRAGDGSGGDLPEDLAAWLSLSDAGIAERFVDRVLARSGAITEPSADIGVEIWTETELAALHAFDHLAQQHPGDPAISARVREAVRWHTQTLQPDNATNHPWAIHAFVRTALSDDPASADARFHAETLLNICCVSMGRPDRFSACILLDAANALD